MKACIIYTCLILDLTRVLSLEVPQNPTDMPFSSRDLIKNGEKMRSYIKALNSIKVLPLHFFGSSGNSDDLLIDNERIPIPSNSKGLEQAKKIQLDKSKLQRYLDILNLESSTKPLTIELDPSKVMAYVRILEDMNKASRNSNELINKSRIKMMKGTSSFITENNSPNDSGVRAIGGLRVSRDIDAQSSDFSKKKCTKINPESHGYASNEIKFNRKENKQHVFLVDNNKIRSKGDNIDYDSGNEVQHSDHFLENNNLDGEQNLRYSAQVSEIESQNRFCNTTQADRHVEKLDEDSSNSFLNYSELDNAERSGNNNAHISEVKSELPGAIYDSGSHEDRPQNMDSVDIGVKPMVLTDPVLNQLKDANVSFQVHLSIPLPGVTTVSQVELQDPGVLRNLQSSIDDQQSVMFSQSNTKNGLMICELKGSSSGTNKNSLTGGLNDKNLSDIILEANNFENNSLSSKKIAEVKDNNIILANSFSSTNYSKGECENGEKFKTINENIYSSPAHNKKEFAEGRLKSIEKTISLNTNHKGDQIIKPDLQRPNTYVKQESSNYEHNDAPPHSTNAETSQSTKSRLRNQYSSDLLLSNDMTKYNSIHMQRHFLDKDYTSKDNKEMSSCSSHKEADEKIDNTRHDGINSYSHILMPSSENEVSAKDHLSNEKCIALKTEVNQRSYSNVNSKTIQSDDAPLKEDIMTPGSIAEGNIKTLSPLCNSPTIELNSNKEQTHKETMKGQEHFFKPVIEIRHQNKGISVSNNPFMPGKVNQISQNQNPVIFNSERINSIYCSSSTSQPIAFSVSIDNFQIERKLYEPLSTKNNFSFKSKNEKSITQERISTEIPHQSESMSRMMPEKSMVNDKLLFYQTMESFDNLTSQEEGILNKIMADPTLKNCSMCINVPKFITSVAVDKGSITSGRDNNAAKISSNLPITDKIAQEMNSELCHSPMGNNSCVAGQKSIPSELQVISDRVASITEIQNPIKPLNLLSHNNVPVIGSNLESTATASSPILNNKLNGKQEFTSKQIVKNSFTEGVPENKPNLEFFPLHPEDELNGLIINQGSDRELSVEKSQIKNRKITFYKPTKPPCMGNGWYGGVYHNNQQLKNVDLMVSNSGEKEFLAILNNNLQQINVDKDALKKLVGKAIGAERTDNMMKTSSDYSAKDKGEDVRTSISEKSRIQYFPKTAQCNTDFIEVMFPRAMEKWKEKGYLSNKRSINLPNKTYSMLLREK